MQHPVPSCTSICVSGWGAQGSCTDFVCRSPCVLPLTNCALLRTSEVSFLFQLIFLPMKWWRKKWQPTPVFLPGESHGQRSLVGSMGSHRVGHNWSDLACMHALEKEMATHSSILAWRIPGTEEPGGLQSMGSHRVGHNWSDLAAAAAAAVKWGDFPGCGNLSLPSELPSRGTEPVPLHFSFFYLITVEVFLVLSDVWGLLMFGSCSVRTVLFVHVFLMYLCKIRVPCPTT